MVTRWNTVAGREYEMDPRVDSWHWLSPDIMVANGGIGNSDGRVDVGKSNEVRVRLRNKGTNNAADISIGLHFRFGGWGDWLEATDSYGMPARISGASLDAGEESWFSVIWSPLAGSETGSIRVSQ